MATLSPSTPKAQHYHTALTSVLTAGAWAADPCASKYGSTTPTLGWDELIRKWAKHCGGSTVLIHQLQEISVLYLSSRTHPSPSPDSDISALSSAGSFVHVAPISQPQASSSSRQNTATELDGDDDVHSSRWWAGVIEDKRMQVREHVKTLQVSLDSGKLSEPERHSCQLLVAYHLHALGDHTQALQIYSTVNWAAEGVVPGEATLVDHIRGRCLQGVSLELQPSPAPSLAIDTYTAAADLLPSSAPFERYREAHRFVSRALTRAAVLCLRTAVDPQRARAILEKYHTVARSWPTSFRPNQRAAMLRMHLGALEAQAVEQQIVDALEQGQQLLGTSTSFPRAGENNTQVQDFAIKAVRLYDQHPSPALRTQAIKIQWWAMQLTYHSQAVLRHLVRLLADSAQPADHQDAKRCFELYVRLVLKARQTQTHAASDDDDETFVKALIHGARFLVTTLAEPAEAWRYVVLAGERDVLIPQVEEAKGVVRMAMAMKGAEAADRPIFQAQALNHLKAATSTDINAHPTAEAFYHLAYAHASARAIEPATVAIRAALELAPLHVQSWHLLALLLTAQGDWHGAEKALDVGLRVWEEADAEAGAGVESEVLDNQEGVESKDFAQAKATTSQAPSPITRSKPRPELRQVLELRMTANVVAEKLHGHDVALERQQELFLFFSQRVALMPIPVQKEDSVHELSGSFVTVTDTGAGPKGLGESMISVHPPDSSVTTDSSPAVSDHEPELHTDTEKHVKKHHFLPRHLHVPSTGSSLGRSRSHQSAGNLSVDRQRTVSATSTAPPTIAHSYYRGGSQPVAPPPPPPVISDATKPSRSPFEARILSRLWLLSAATFRRAGKLGQALGAIQEAEVMDPENPDVWVQLGLYHMATSSPALALPTFSKAMLLKPDYAPTVVSLAKLYLTTGSVELAHSLLNQLTQSTGWDVPEAWYYLAKVCEAQGGRQERARECLMYALELEKSRPCRVLSEAVDCWL